MNKEPQGQDLQLNENQEAFVKRYLATGDKNKAYGEIYETTNPNSTSSASTRLLRQDKIQQAIIKELEQVGLKNLKMFKALNTIIDKVEETDVKTSDVIKAIELSLNLKGIQTKKPTIIEQSEDEIELQSKSTEELKDLLHELERQEAQLDSQMSRHNADKQEITQDQSTLNEQQPEAARPVDSPNSEKNTQEADEVIKPRDNDAGMATYRRKRKVTVMS